MIHMQELKIDQLKLVYRTEQQTKWLLKMEAPNRLQTVKIYLTRPANETSVTLLHAIKSYKNLNELFKKQESLF